MLDGIIDAGRNVVQEADPREQGIIHIKVFDANAVEHDPEAVLRTKGAVSVIGIPVGQVVIVIRDCEQEGIKGRTDKRSVQERYVKVKAHNCGMGGCCHRQREASGKESGFQTVEHATLQKQTGSGPTPKNG